MAVVTAGRGRETGLGPADGRGAAAGRVEVGLGVRCEVTASWELVLPLSLAGGQPSVRELGALRPVLADGGAELEGRRVVYRIYRDVAPPEARARLRAAGLRHDLTVVLPGTLGRERPKTFGHYHSEAACGLAYPELYQVLAGRALFVLQRDGAAGGVAEVRLSVAGPGEAVVVPPGFGHVTVNAGSGPLVVANLVAESCRSDHAPYAARRGAAWYVLARAAAVPWVLQPNPSYPRAGVPRVVAPRPLGFRLLDLAGEPDALAFLADPARGLPEWLGGRGMVVDG